MRRAEVKNVGMESSDSSSENFGIQIAADEIRMGNFLRQTDAEVKSQEVAKLSDVRQCHFEMAQCLFVIALIDLLN